MAKTRKIAASTIAWTKGAQKARACATRADAVRFAETHLEERPGRAFIDGFDTEAMQMAMRGGRKASRGRPYGRL